MKFTLFEVEFRESKPSDKYGVYIMVGFDVILVIMIIYGLLTGTHYG